MMFFRYLKFCFFVFVSITFYFIAIKLSLPIWQEIVKYIILPLSFIILNYAFIKLILYYIWYFNNLLIFHKDKIIVIKSTLLDTDNIEIIDLNKITKMDAFSNGIIPNILGYGTLVIEQQREKVREFWYIPKPYKACNYLNDAKVKSAEKNK